MSVKFLTSTNGVDPLFLADLTEVCTESPYDWGVYRLVPPAGQQARLYAEWIAWQAAHPGQTDGPLAAPPGRSAHEEHPASLVCTGGLAGDVTHLVGGDTQTWDYGSPAWADLIARVRAHPRLHSGADFKKDTNGKVPNDPDHIESTEWFAVRAGLEASGKW